MKGLFFVAVNSLFVLAAFTLAGCGVADRVWDNPNDPIERPGQFAEPVETPAEPKPTPTLPEYVSKLESLKNWHQVAYVKAANAGSYDRFGYSVSLSGDLLAIGAYGEESSQTNITNGTGAATDNNVSNSGAVYVYIRTSAGWAQEAYIKARNAGVNDYFGESVSLSGDALAVGATGEDSIQTTIINGNSSSVDNGAENSGAVYIYRRSISGWSQEAYVKASNAGPSDSFGTDVSLSGDSLAVGASGEASSQFIITNGATASADNGAVNAGAVYVYRRSGSGWYQEAYLKASNADANDYFGLSVSLFGDTLAVGAPGEASNLSTITNGEGASADNSAVNAGAVYIYRRSGGTWAQEAYLKPTNADASDVFGASVSHSGDTLAVGAFGESSKQNAITNGSTASSDDSFSFSGAVYVYRRTQSTWGQEAYIKTGNAGTNDFFGESVSLSGDTLIVGATGEDSNQNTITNGNGASVDNSASNSGAVYVFRRSLTAWAQDAFVKAMNVDESDSFGSSISLSGDTFVVGAPGERSSQKEIINGDRASIDNELTEAGAVYVYRNKDRIFDPHLRVSARTSSSITLSWYASPGRTVKIAPASTGALSPASCSSSGTITLPASVTSYVYVGLNSNSKYGFRVCSFDGANVSSGSTIWENTTP